MAKFKVGERARIVSGKPEPGYERYRNSEVVIVEICKPGEWFDYEVEAISDGCLMGIKEYALRKLLPDSDTYHPADISIDDLMRGLRETEYV